MKHSVSLALPLAAAVLALAAPTHAQTFQTYLDGAQEPSNSAATGFGTVTLDAGGPTGEYLLVSESVTGLSSGLTEMHIHGPAAPGYDGPVLYNIASAAMGDPLHLLGKTSFSFTNFEIDLPGVVTADNGSQFAQASQVAFLDAGVDYVNVHTADYPSGEIRGQIPSNNPVPETGTAVSFGLLLTLGGFAIARRRAARSAA